MLMRGDINFSRAFLCGQHDGAQSGAVNKVLTSTLLRERIFISRYTTIYQHETSLIVSCRIISLSDEGSCVRSRAPNSSNCFQSSEFHSGRAADSRGLFVAFHNREETSSSSCARQKQSANLGVRSPAGQFHGYWSYTWQKTVRAETLDSLSLLVLIVRATSMSDHAFLFLAQGCHF